MFFPLLGIHVSCRLWGGASCKPNIHSCRETCCDGILAWQRQQQQRASHLDKAGGVSRDTRNADMCVANIPPWPCCSSSAPAPGEVQEGLVRQDGWLLGTGCTTAHQNKSLLPYLQCTIPYLRDQLHLKTKPHFLPPSLHRAPSAPELNNILPAPNHRFIAIHLPPPFVLFLLTRFAFFFFFSPKQSHQAVTSGAPWTLEQHRLYKAGARQCLGNGLTSIY